MKFRTQTVVLETNEGTCIDEDMLRMVWETRLQALGTKYYKIKEVRIRDASLKGEK